MGLPLATSQAEPAWRSIQRVHEQESDSIACHVCPLERRQDGDLWLLVRFHKTNRHGKKSVAMVGIYKAHLNGCIAGTGVEQADYTC